MDPRHYHYERRSYTQRDIIIENLIKTECSRINTKSYMKYDKKQKRGF